MSWIVRILGAVLGLAALAIAGSLGWLAYGPEPAPMDPPAAQTAKAREILKDQRWAPPQGWRWAEFKRPDGTVLRFGFAPAPITNASGRPVPALVFVPGFGGTIEQNFEMLRDLQNGGAAIFAIELRGQGGSSRPLPAQNDFEKSHLGDFKVYADDLAAFLAELVAPMARGPVVLSGLSLGGHAVLRTAIETPQAADGYALIAPAIAIRLGMPESRALLLTGTVTAIGGGAHYAPTQGPRDWLPERLEGVGSCGADRERAAAMNAWSVTEPETRIGGGSNLWLKSFVESTQLVRDPARLAAVDRPVLLINPQLDHLVVPEASAAACSTLSNCREVALATAHHCPFHDPEPEYQAALAALSGFVQEFTTGPEVALAVEGLAP